jgi:hypothetical protein
MDVLSRVLDELDNTFLNISDRDGGDEETPEWGLVECWVLVLLLVLRPGRVVVGIVELLVGVLLVFLASRLVVMLVGLVLLLMAIGLSLLQQSTGNWSLGNVAVELLALFPLAELVDEIHGLVSGGDGVLDAASVLVDALNGDVVHSNRHDPLLITKSKVELLFLVDLKDVVVVAAGSTGQDTRHDGTVPDRSTRVISWPAVDKFGGRVVGKDWLVTAGSEVDNFVNFIDLVVLVAVLLEGKRPWHLPLVFLF